MAMPTDRASSIAIRRLTPEADAAAYREIRLEALRLSPRSFGSDFATESARPLEVFAERLTSSEVFGAHAAARLVGIAGLLVRSGLKEVHKGYLWGVYVRPEARGAGVARGLANAVLVAARERVEILQLTVESANAAARGLYASLGFVEYGLEKKALKVDGEYSDEVHMALDFSAE
jgi:ribosomal protein S18 acetylase RimI-like enzyme